MTIVLVDSLTSNTNFFIVQNGTFISPRSVCCEDYVVINSMNNICCSTCRIALDNWSFLDSRTLEICLDNYDWDSSSALRMFISRWCNIEAVDIQVKVEYD